jgi:hypothetical protein
VLEAEAFGHEEECLFAITSCSFSRERFQPETLGVSLRHFVVTESPPPAA